MLTTLPSSDYQTIRQEAKVLARQHLRDLPQAQTMLLIFSTPLEFVTASYAALEAQHRGIPYRPQPPHYRRLADIIQAHSIQVIWCSLDLREGIQKALSKQKPALYPRLISGGSSR